MINMFNNSNIYRICIDKYTNYELVLLVSSFLFGIFCCETSIVCKDFTYVVENQAIIFTFIWTNSLEYLTDSRQRLRHFEEKYEVEKAWIAKLNTFFSYLPRKIAKINSCEIPSCQKREIKSLDFITPRTLFLSPSHPSLWKVLFDPVTSDKLIVFQVFMKPWNSKQ